MSWQIVVASLILVALAVHFGEKAKERAIAARRRASQEGQRARLHELSLALEVREAWSADVRAMTIQVARTEAGAAEGAPQRFELERSATGVWTIKSTGAPPLPARVAQRLEERYRLICGARSEPG